MKKIFFIAAILLTSCESEVGELLEIEAPRLVVNALIAAGEDNQEVIFHQTSKTEATSAFQTKFEIRVNSNVVCSAKSDLLMGDRNGYQFSAESIRPGDRVSIEAQNGTMKASAETVVPEPVTIVGIDTMSVMAKRYSYSSIRNLQPHTRYMVRLRLPEGSNQNETQYFRVRVYKDVYAWSQATEKNGQITEIRYNIDDDHSHFSYSQDPALCENENNLLENSDSAIEIDWLSGNMNEYLVFRSSFFKDGEYTLRLDLPAAKSSDFGWYQNVRFRIYSISHLEYNYLLALSNLKSYDPGVITNGEPLIPSNIMGGAGIFCVESFAESETFFEDHRTYELVDGVYVKK